MRHGPCSEAADDGFDRWVDRKLHELFDEVVGEAVPERLRRLVERLEAAGLDDDAASGDGEDER